MNHKRSGIYRRHSSHHLMDSCLFSPPKESETSSSSLRPQDKSEIQPDFKQSIADFFRIRFLSGINCFERSYVTGENPRVPLSDEDLMLQVEKYSKEIDALKNEINVLKRRSYTTSRESYCHPNKGAPNADDMECGLMKRGERIFQLLDRLENHPDKEKKRIMEKNMNKRKLGELEDSQVVSNTDLTEKECQDKRRRREPIKQLPQAGDRLRVREQHHVRRESMKENIPICFPTSQAADVVEKDGIHCILKSNGLKDVKKSLFQASTVKALDSKTSKLRKMPLSNASNQGLDEGVQSYFRNLDKRSPAFQIFSDSIEIKQM